MQPSGERARELLQERVCSVCTDRRIDGSCAVGDDRECVFDKHIQQIVAAVARVRSPHIQDYLDAIRSDVCSICDGQDEDGYCEHRTRVECALDAYVVLVVETIEAARRAATDGGTS